MPHWSDQMLPSYIANVANRYIVDNPLQAFDIFPAVRTNRLTGYIGTYTKADWLRIGSAALYKRSGATESFGDDFTVDKQAYTVEQYSFHKDITKDDAREYDNPFDPVNDAIDFVITRMGRVLLTELIATYFASGIWAAGDVDYDDSGYDKWDAKTSGTSDADPVEDVMTMHAAIKKTTGYMANKLIITWDVFKALKSNTNITSRMKTTADQIVTKDLLAKLFEVEKLIILDPINEGATDFLTKGKLLLCYTPSRPSKFAPSAGYHITYVGESNGRQVGTRKILMPTLNDAVRIEADMYVDQLVVGTDLGYFAQDVVS